MGYLRQLYRPSLGLLTDLYQLTMAYGYWKPGSRDREAVFHLFFRENPFEGGFTVACGLATAVEYLEDLRFDAEDLAYLATLDGQRRPAALRAGVPRLPRANCGSSATSTPSPKARSSFPTSRWCA